LNLGLALTLGLLVGVERGWQEREAAEGSRLRSLSAVVLADSWALNRQTSRQARELRHANRIAQSAERQPGVAD